MADNNDKKQMDGGEIGGAGAPAAGISAPSSFGAYASGTGYTLDLSEDRWNKEFKQNGGKLWKESPQGRMAMRCFSRGVLGAVFYAAGQRYAAKQMASYHPAESPKNWVQQIARGFDEVAGKPIEYTVNMLGGDGHRAVTFRPTRKFYDLSQDGRTLGHEIVGVTFDFAAMSTGDAMGRDIAGLFDPNARHCWVREDGSINAPQAAKTLALNAFRYLTYNQGEDWAVALPYVYFKRAQRNIINKFSPGFAYDSDRNLSGGSFKVNDQGKIVGNYMLEGMLDLQGRFTAYNIGTLMYREAYTEAADKLLKLAEGDIKPSDLLPKNKPLLDVFVDKAKELVRWGGRSAIKGTVYMTPAMPFFWGTRVPQTRFRGLLIHPEKGAVSFRSSNAPYPGGADLLHINEMRRPANQERSDEWKFTPETQTFFGKYNGRNMDWHITESVPNPLAGGELDAFKSGPGIFDKTFTTIGRWNNNLRKDMHIASHLLEQHGGIDQHDWKTKRFTDTYINAALSYTPYFATKAEFARLWDSGKMDMSAERVVDAIGDLNPGEFAAGLKDVWHSIRMIPLSDPEREKKAQERIAHDISPADIFDPMIFQPGHRGSVIHKELAKAQSIPCNTPPDNLLADTPNKQGFVERLNMQKQQASQRLQQFRNTVEPTPAMLVSQLQPSQAKAEDKSQEQQPAPSHAQQEMLRMTQRDDLPGQGTTIH